MFAYLPFFLLFLGISYLIEATYGFFRLDKRAWEMKRKRDARLEGRSFVSFDRVRGQIRRGLVLKIALGLFFCIAILGRLSISALEPKELSLTVEKGAYAQSYEGIIEEFLKTKSIPGLVVGVIHGEAEYLFSYGYRDLKRKHKVDGTTLFELGSISKAFTGLLLADAIENESMGLSDSVAGYLDPEKLGGHTAFQTITLEQLTTHTAGLRRSPPSLFFTLRAVFSSLTGGNPYNYLTKETLYRYMAKERRLKDPREKWTYSNYATGILALSLIEAGGLSFEDLLQERIASPLGMENTSIGYHLVNRDFFAEGYQSYLTLFGLHLGIRNRPWIMDDVFGGVGGIRSSGHDMLSFLRGMLHGTLPFARTSTEALYRINERSEMGMNWILHRDGTIWHNGQTGGFNSYLGFSDSVGVFALANSTVSVQELAEELLAYAYSQREQ